MRGITNAEKPRGGELKYRDYTCTFSQTSKGGYFYFFVAPSGTQAVSFCVDYTSVNASTATNAIQFYLGVEGLGTTTNFIFCNQSVSNIKIRVFFRANTDLEGI